MQTSTNINDIEIMSPVGSYEALSAAIQAGCNAIYFGIGNLNMRSGSGVNFNIEDIKTIVSICKEDNVRTYLTLNTIIYDSELNEFKEVLDEAKKQDISAVIASDLAVISYAHKIGLEIHISTQCNITNIEAVKFFSQFADVMVTARELSLQQVANIIEIIDIENICGPSGKRVKIEIFAHGALCMAVSGKCYLSLDNYNKSANRGKCLQLCRRPYKLSEMEGEGEAEVEISVDNKYLLSPKDLKTIDFLDKILKAGVRVLKIEGRGRSADYVKTVTSVYRSAVDAYFAGDFMPKNIEIWNNSLRTVYNRGFWDGYYLGRTMGEWSNRYGSQATIKKVYVGKVTNFFAKLNVAEIKMETGSIDLNDKYLIMGPTTGVYEDIFTDIRVDLKSVGSTQKGEYCSIPVKDIVRRGDKLYRLDTVVEEF